MGLGGIHAVPLLLPRGGKSHPVLTAPPQLRAHVRRWVQQQWGKALGVLVVLAWRTLIFLTRVMLSENAPVAAHLSLKT